MADGLKSYGAYVPGWRVDKAEMAAAVGERARGTRAVASFDQDTTTLGVSAALLAMRAGLEVDSVWFATSAPAYVDKTNATAIHAALSLPRETAAFDLGSSVRSAVAAMLAGSRTRGLAVLADIRGGIPGSSDERTGGDAAAAFVFGHEDLVAELVGTGSTSEEFLDRWAQAGDASSHTWEERFGEQHYLALADDAVRDAMKAAAIAPGDIDCAAVVGPNTRAVRAVTAAQRRELGPDRLPAGPADTFGNAGVAAFGLALATLLETAEPGDLLMVTSVADGADTLIFRATDRLPEFRAARPDTAPPAELQVGYPTYLMWRGHLARETPRRPDPLRPSAPFAARNVHYKFGFLGGRCRECSTVQFPLPPVCLHCRARDSFDVVSGAGATGRITTFTVDRLAFTPNPPLVSAVVDLDDGGRVQVEVTDVPVEDLAIGLPVRLTFRRLMTVDGIHNYFWKAGPN